MVCMAQLTIFSPWYKRAPNYGDRVQCPGPYYKLLMLLHPPLPAATDTGQPKIISRCYAATVCPNNSLFVSTLCSVVVSLDLLALKSLDFPSSNNKYIASSLVPGCLSVAVLPAGSHWPECI